ncbi:MAG: MarC family protein [Lentisphaeria bacterium]|nr:MarC family protein [Lentisphaeria bacterium]
MELQFSTIAETSLYFLALINPASKIFFLTAHKPALTTPELRHIARRASLFAFIILAGSAAGGKVILENIFKVHLYALQLSGGLVLLFSGLAAVQKGAFYHEQDNQHVSHDELSVVPLAAPLIAGPGTIAATISFSIQLGFIQTLIALTPALLINLIAMYASRYISKMLEFLVFVGPVIRLTGLVVMAIAMQMMLTGIGGFINQLQLP